MSHSRSRSRSDSRSPRYRRSKRWVKYIHVDLQDVPDELVICCIGLVPTLLIVVATVDLALVLVQDLVAAPHGGNEGHPDPHPQTTLGHVPELDLDLGLVHILHVDVGGLVPDPGLHSFPRFAHRDEAVLLLLLFNLHSCMYAYQLHVPTCTCTLMCV